MRLRLTQKEVADLNHDGAVECEIHFPGGQSLGYSVVSGTGMTTAYMDNSIRVTLPEAVVKQWAESNEVTIEGFDGETHILVEKDFQCLHQERADPEAFPNPNA